MSNFGKMKWNNKLREKLHGTGSRLGSGLSALFGSKPDNKFLGELERRLLAADVGMVACKDIIESIKAQAKHERIGSMKQLVAAVEAEITTILKPCECISNMNVRNRPYVVLMVGVNGSGKTTTAAKLAYHYKKQGQTVMLAAADTFRAAAIEQLRIWAQRCDIPVVAQSPGSDSAAIVYDAMASAEARSINVVIADTAGRLHTDKNLIEELQKIKRVATKQNENAPDEIILVIDGTTGQNAKKQVAEFHKFLGLDSLIVTKLDGSAKGGIVIAIAQETKIPIRFIGVGEALDDLHIFNATEYATAIMQV